MNQLPTATPLPEATVVFATSIADWAPQATPAQLPVSSTDCEAEIGVYRDLLAGDADLPAFQVPLIASCLAEAGERAAAIALYQGALDGELDRLTEVTVRQGLGDLLSESGDYEAAVAQYDAILTVAETEVSRSRALYQAGQAELQAANLEAGYGRLLSLITDHPKASQSYPALNELLAAGYPIDDTVQGLVAYEAGAYDVSAAAFARAVEDGNDVAIETQLHLAWSLERLGDVDGALARLDAFVAARETPAGATAPNLAEAARGRLERARLNDRAGRLQAALEAYQAYLDLYPLAADAPEASWRWAVLAESNNDRILARDRYLAFGQTYPDHRDAARAFFRAGFLALELGQPAEAQAIWRQAFDTYPERDYGAAALLWLLKSLPQSQQAPYIETALNSNGYGYYAPRAAHLAGGVQPFTSAQWPNLNAGDSGRESAETWLRQWLGLPPGTPVGELSGQLAADPRLQWAERLWSSGSQSEAARQFELLRLYYASDVLASYQLAVYYRDLGLYKSSILAALSLMNQAGVGASAAPRFIARLAYPVYYPDLVATEARSYGYDPLLQFALIREESYFDSLATSPLDARGLSQILPETGANIASQLNWPGYDPGALYRPATAIAFGGYLLNQQIDRYDGNVAAALAAYNAGPAFADGWVQLEADDFDRLLEVIDFPETQRYIKQIYITHAIYRFLYT
jgi:soluble lytic murein transglycosylase